MSRRSVWSSQQTPDESLTIGYIVASFPCQSPATYRAMHNALTRFRESPTCPRYYRENMPTPKDMVMLGIFDGLLD